MTIHPTRELIDDLRHGRMIVLADAEDRENEGDLVMAADFVTPEAINFMAMHARGLICLTLTQERCRQLSLALMSHALAAGEVSFEDQGLVPGSCVNLEADMMARYVERILAAGPDASR